MLKKNFIAITIGLLVMLLFVSCDKSSSTKDVLTSDQITEAAEKVSKEAGFEIDVNTHISGPKTFKNGVAIDIIDKNDERVGFVSWAKFDSKDSAASYYDKMSDPNSASGKLPAEIEYKVLDSASGENYKSTYIQSYIKDFDIYSYDHMYVVEDTVITVSCFKETRDWAKDFLKEINY